LVGHIIEKDGEFIDIGTTHMELRNDVTTKKALNKIFDGGVGSFFFTKERN
jgi:acyl-CoA hydrolase